MQKAVKERLAPGRVEREVNEMATQFIRGSVEQILGVAFGFDKRWRNQYELHRGFETGAIAAKLNEMVASEEITRFLEETIGDFRKHMKPKAIREWQKKYRESYLEAFWTRADELIDLNAKKHGHKDAEIEFDKIMRETFNSVAEIPQGHPLSGDDESEEDGEG